MKDKMDGEFELMVNCRLCREKPDIVETIQIRIPELAGHLVRMSDGRVIK
jgi:hypothetical protein